MPKRYFDVFFKEKEVPYEMYEIEASDGNVHLIDSDTVIELIKGTSGREAETIRETIVKLDFANASLSPFLKSLATWYVATNY